MRHTNVTDPLFAYFGPETFLPMASIIGAVGGVVMMFGRTILRWAARAKRALFDRSA
jgi:hypothetical protein